MTATDPTISVIIPAYNSQATIDRAIESVIAQTRSAHEIIVVDDGSAEPLAPHLARYGAAVRCIRQANAGAAAARNTGIAEATGAWIGFLDADDLWAPEKLALQSAAIFQHPDAGLIASRYFTQEPGSSRHELVPCRSRFLNVPFAARGEDLFDLAGMIWTGTVLIRRDALNGDRFVSGLEPAEDRDLWLRVLTHHRAIVLSDPLATAVLEPNSLSRHDADHGYEPMIRVLHRHSQHVSPAVMKKLETNVYRSWAGAHLGDGRARRAIRPALNRLRREPFSPQAWWIAAKSAALGWRSPAAPVRSGDRDEAALRRHFDIERALANKLRAASPERRRSLYGEVYNELFARVYDHPQNRRKCDAKAQESSTKRQLRLLGRFLSPQTRYLEIGAGDCHLTMAIARRARSSTGVEVSNVIAGLTDQPSNFSLLISDGVHIDVPAASINLAYSNQLMEHLHPDDAAAQLAEIRRAIAPGGRYVVITPHRYSGPHDISQFFEHTAVGFHLKEYTYRELRALMLASGFDATEVWCGLKGRFFRVPQALVLGLEALLGALPARLRRAATRSIVFRPLFTNVQLIARMSNARTMTDDSPAVGDVLSNAS